ncbi:MAG: WD40 repeat domain-containing protein [Isosphaerales bacterium]
MPGYVQADQPDIFISYAHSDDLFGAAQPVWARSQLQLARKVAALRTSGYLPIAIYEGPPSETKDLLKFRLPHMDVLNCRAGLSEEIFRFRKAAEPLRDRFSGDLRVWRLETLRRLAHKPELLLKAPRALAISPDGRWCAAGGGGDDQRAGFRLWDLSADYLPPQGVDVKDRPNDISALAFSSDGRRLVAFSGPRAATWDLGDPSQPPISFGNHGGSLKSVDLSQDKYLAVTALDNSVRI